MDQAPEVIRPPVPQRHLEGIEGELVCRLADTRQPTIAREKTSVTKAV
jgi:hypothetical protein